MPAHPDELISLVAGEVDASTLAARHGVTEAEVLNWRAAFIAGMRAASSRPPPRRWGRWALAAVLLVGTGAFAQLVTFTADAPAQASQVNQNFTQLRTWIETKVGSVNESFSRPSALFPTYASWNGLVANATGGAGIVNDNTNYSSLMVVGNTSGGGNVRRVRVYDELTIPNGSIGASGNIIANGNLTAGGSCTVGSDLSVSGNTWGSNPAGQGWLGRAPCPQLVNQRCPNGQFVCGINFQHACGANWWEEQVALECCAL